jgi:hypothetical protein
MRAEKMATERMAAERVTVGRTKAGRATAKREAADGLEKRAETNWNLVLLSVGGVSWVGAGWVGTAATA